MPHKVYPLFELDIRRHRTEPSGLGLFKLYCKCQALGFDQETPEEKPSRPDTTFAAGTLLEGIALSITPWPFYGPTAKHVLESI